MGPILPKPVTTKVLERKQNKAFRVGLASMNGFREKQEDAHAMLLNNDWGFFGVFDGHCGPLCSQYEAKRFMEVLSADGSKFPISDQYINDLCLRLDKEFLDTQQEGGSTGTFMVAYPQPSGKFRLQVGNVGDSRVVAGRRKGKECRSMTEDHKPSNDGERMRIERAGGHVANNRVDGSLAVSRAFGDGNYKDGKSELEHKVIAQPEITTDMFEPGDIVLLCCDGVFESDVFSNESVIAFIFERYDEMEKKGVDHIDLSQIAADVCDAALERGSKDNISAMIVQLGGAFPAKEQKPHEEVQPGPYFGGQAAIHNEKFRTAYKSMCETAHMTLGQMLEMRYQFILKRSEEVRKSTQCDDKKQTCTYEKLSDEDLGKLLKRLGEDPQSQVRKEMISNIVKFEGKKDCRPANLQEWEEEEKEMKGEGKELESKKAGTQQRFDYWTELADKKASEEGQAPDGQDAVTQKILELQRAGLPLPIILGLLAQQRGGQGGMPGV